MYAPKHTYTQTLKQPSRLYLYKQRFCWSCAADLLFSVCASFFCGLKQQLSRSCRSFFLCHCLSITLPLTLPLSLCHPRFSPIRCPLLLSHCPFVILSAFCHVSLPERVSKECFPSFSSPLSLLHLPPYPSLSLS